MNEASSELPSAGMKLPLAGFVLDLGAARLCDAQGRGVELRPQAWAVLRHLALSAGRLVTKEELLEAIWPGLVVTDGSLAQAVSDVREALGEAGHRVIKTVPKRGYMLVADAVQLSAPTGAERLPRTNVPVASDPLIGREADIATLTQWLAEHRLVTVLGAGGIGKTRLAQALARERQGLHAHGVWWVDLAALSAAEQVAPAIAMAAGLRLDEGDAAAALGRALADRDTLLVLDNCEHLAAGVADVVQAMLAAAPAVRLLATSQETLRVPGEHLYRLDTLAVPPPDAPLDAARRCSALRLLEQRARDADRHFELREDMLGAAIELCRQLDGIPLAIEMAAARLPTLGIDAVRRLVAEKMLSNACAARRRASRHCAPRPSGAMHCSTRMSRPCCGSCRCSPAASGSIRRGASWPSRDPASRPRSTRSTRWSASRCCRCSAPIRRATACWRRCGCSRRSNSTRRARPTPRCSGMAARSPSGPTRWSGSTGSAPTRPGWPAASRTSTRAGDLNGAIALGSAIVAETSAEGQTTTLCEALTTLCAAYSRKGDFAAARSAARRALPMALREGRAGPLFDHLALLAALTGRAAAAAKLLGCADAWNARSQRARGRSEARSAELAAQRIEPTLGAAEYRRLRSVGAELPVEQGSALAEELLANGE